MPCMGQARKGVIGFRGNQGYELPGHYPSDLLVLRRKTLEDGRE
jgi:hypothetical protein